VSFLPDPLRVISKPGSGAWQAAAVERLRPKKEPKELAIAVPRTRAFAWSIRRTFTLVR
jgi:hypothetical protein